MKEENQDKKDKANKKDEKTNEVGIKKMIENKIEDILSKTLKDIIHPVNITKLLNNCINKNYNEELINRDSFKNIQNITRSFKRKDIYDEDDPDIIKEDNSLEEK